MKRASVRHAMKRLFTILITVFLGLAFAPPRLLAQCPPQHKVETGIQIVTKRKLEIVSIKPSPAPGLCQVVIKMKGRKRILYTDATGDFFVFGQIINAKNGKNLTREASQELNRFGPDELAKLDKLTAFSLGKADKTLYFVTDPQCPYCKRAEKILKKFIDSGQLTVKFLLFPLSFHKGAKKQCISIICDKKGMAGLEKGYQSDNQCAEGKKKVEDTLSFLSRKGISGTPTYIFPDGRFHSGVINQPRLQRVMALSPLSTLPQPQKGAESQQRAKESPANQDKKKP